MSDVRVERLHQSGCSISAINLGGRVIVEFWFESRLPGADPLRIEMTPGDALGLVERAAKAAKSALQESLK